MRITELAITARDERGYNVSGKTRAGDNFGPFEVDVVRIGGVRTALYDGGTIEITDGSGTRYEIDFTTVSVTPSETSDGTSKVLDVSKYDNSPAAIPVDVQER